MMSHIREVTTTHHIYRTQDHLGTGASCEVYTGIEKSTGRRHALKIFHDAIWARSEERRREVSALRRLKHPNIVVLVGEEEETGTGRQLLVLELCTEGSLHTYLREPHNYKGLTDSEFILLLKDLSAALRHLHDNNIVHRDIKPGNILRQIDPDGSCIYKLSDFGTCRVLSEGDQFMSLAGTEEYLHPDVYKKAFVDRESVVFFDSSVDFWSVGCSLYQAACGQTPFRPHGGARNNRKIMFDMIAKKESGVISGHQRSASEAIIWDRYLPKNCKLTPSLKTPVTDLISCLLEKDQRTLMSRDQYQHQVQTITSQTETVVFNMEEMSHIVIYLKPGCSLAELQDLVAGKTDIMAEDQLLYHKGCKLSDLMADGARVDLLSSDLSQPIILASKSETDSDVRKPGALDTPPNFQMNSSLEHDCNIGHKMAVMLCDVHERVSNFINIQNNFENGKTCMMNYVQKHHLDINRACSNFKCRLEEFRARLDLHSDLEQKRIKVTLEANDSITKKCGEARSSIPKLQRMVQDVKLDLGRSKEITEIFRSEIFSTSRCSGKCVSKAFNLSQKGRDIWREMYRRKKHRPLSEREQFCHIGDRTGLEDVLTSSLSLYDDHCLPNYNRLVRLSRQCVENFHEIVAGVLQSRNTLSEVKSNLKAVEGLLFEINAYSGRAWSDASKQLNSLREGSLSGLSLCNSLDKLKPNCKHKPTINGDIRENQADNDHG